ncbi:MAG: hypothetical protein C5B50_15825 [Verrucomicrobia bacterium]|nr:MAG: hypothetical protein C5B50_15825 [Verrucomicrobiota bacterium]
MPGVSLCTPMSFDVFLFKFAKGDACELSRDALRSVFDKHEFKRTGEHFYDIRLQDGSEVELQAGGLTSSERFTTATFLIRGGSDSIARLIFECAQVTGGVLIPTMDQNPCIVVDTTQRAELPPDFTQPVVECRSGAPG